MISVTAITPACPADQTGGNRHCIICQNNKAEEWLKKQKQMLLPLTYFLATFTLPEDLRKSARQNQRLIYNMLFKAAADAVKLLAKDKKYLGAETGMIGILHTRLEGVAGQAWARTLAFHPHVHFLILPIKRDLRQAAVFL